jgi:hypothetical protein
LGQRVVIRQFRGLTLVLQSPAGAVMPQVHSYVPLQGECCASNACVTLAQFDAYTKALQVIRAESAKLFVPLYMHGAIIPT